MHNKVYEIQNYRTYKNEYLSEYDVTESRYASSIIDYAEKCEESRKEVVKDLLEELPTGCFKLTDEGNLIMVEKPTKFAEEYIQNIKNTAEMLTVDSLKETNGLALHDMKKAVCGTPFFETMVYNYELGYVTLKRWLIECLKKPIGTTFYLCGVVVVHA